MHGNIIKKRIVFLVFCLSIVAVLTLSGPAASVQAGSTQTTPSNADRPRSLSEQIMNDPILSGLWAGINIRFSSSTYRSNSSSTYTKPTTPVSVPANKPALPTSGAYLALGDSVAAGVGLPTTAAVPSKETRCGRTAEAYPNEVSRVMNLPLVHAACSGADADELYTIDWTGGANLPAQLDTAYAGGTPGLITITAGANDVGWQGILRSCYTSSNCATESRNTRFNKSLIRLQNKYIQAFNEINSRAGTTPPVVVVTGYYNPLSPNCTAVTPRISAGEVAWMTAAISALNQTILQTAALYPNVRYAPVDFSGHDICSADPWVQGLADPQPIHPTAAGQQAIAQAVLRTLGR